MMSFLRTFFGRVTNTQQGILLPEELLRSIITALGSGSLFGLAMTILQAVLANAAIIFPNPVVAGLATVVLTLIMDLVRRLNQGPAPAPTPVPVPVPVPIRVSAPQA